MTPSTLHHEIDGASLWVVPSVHFRMAFAEEVNRLCSVAKPDAVAVELGPETAAAASAWLRELGVGSGLLKLPCMLGLATRNQRIRPSRREAAVRLQEITGKDLNELPPELLHQFLGYAAMSVLYFSPTDSIIEALRCALELKVPIYGVDLEETAERQHMPIMLQDPTLASEHMEDYVQRNAGFAEHQRDEEIDSRRELAMAARLKSVLGKHKRILFVCGLAHWQKLQQLLQTVVPQPSFVVGNADQHPSRFQRIVVHPLLAIHHLDTIPAFAAEYEDARRAAPQRSKYHQPMDVRKLYEDMLHNSYEKHFLREETGEQLDRVLEDWEAHHDFERLIRNLCVVHQRQAPDLSTALAAAQGTMSTAFCRVLGETLMEFDWAGPDDFPDLPILAPIPSPAGCPLRAEFIDNQGHRSRWFYVHSLPNRAGITVRVPIPWKWNSEPKGEIPPQRDVKCNWVPFDTLMDALAFRAVHVAQEQAPTTQTELFEGSMLDGVDVKATLRNAAHGGERIFVRSTRRRQGPASPIDEATDGYPVVWILRLASHDEVHWGFSTDSVSRLRSFRNRATEWDQGGLPRNGLMVTSVMAVTERRQDPELSAPNYPVERQSRVGQLNFQPQCCIRRTSKWAEDTKLSFNPVLPAAKLEALVEFYRDRFSWELGNYPWHVNLIRLAIPLARKTVTIIAPDTYTVASIATHEAARRGIRLRFVPLSYFPAKALREISQIIWLPTLGRTKDEVDLPIYPDHVLRYFNEPMDKYHRLIPQDWR